MVENKENQGKGRATPSRKTAQARNARPLIGDHSKEARRELRQQMAAERAKIRDGVAAGDEKYLQPRDKGPQRRYVRDWVDARISVGEFMMPLVLFILFLTMLPLEYQQYGIIVLWSFLALSVIDIAISTTLMKRRMRNKFKDLERGLIWYAATRTMQMRLLRLPKPQVKRFQFPK